MNRNLYGRTALINAAHTGCVRSVAIIFVRAHNNVEIGAEDDQRKTASDFARDGIIPEMLDLARKHQQCGSSSNDNLLTTQLIQTSTQVVRN